MPTNPFNNKVFLDSLPTPTVVDATAGNPLEFEVVPAKAVLHSTLPAPAQSNCWTVALTGAVAAGSGVNSYLGPLIVARKGVPTVVRWTNNTAAPGATQPVPPINVTRPVLTMDPTRWPNPLGLSMHLHGGKLLGDADGWPLAEKPPGATQTCHYPNDQPANLIWYHDHAMDWTARIVHAGIAGGYIIRDPFDDQLMGLIPQANEVPLVLQDRQLWDPAASQLSSIMRYEIDADPNSPGGLTRPAPYGIDSQGNPGQVDVLPEFFGEFNLVNGKLWPKYALPRRDLYRLRIINGCNARTYALKLMAKIAGTWRFVGDLMTVIGTDGGFMGAPIPLQANEELVIAPGERRDVILDLRRLKADHAGGIGYLYLINVAAVPFSSNAASLPTPTNGLTLGLTPASVLSTAASLEEAPFHPQIQAFPQVMRFDVDMIAPAQLRPGFLSVQLPTLLIRARAANPDFRYLGALGWRPRPNVNFGPNRVFLIDNVMAGMPINGQSVGMMYLRECQRLPSVAGADLILRWDANTTGNAANPPRAQRSATEVGYQFDHRMNDMMDDTFERPLQANPPSPGTYERWYFVNLQGNAVGAVPPLGLDMHPVHIHLANFYLARRWSIGADGRHVSAVANPGHYARLALRDTLRVIGNEIVELIVYFPPGYNRPGQAMPSAVNRYPFHCHILEHEEMGMMRYFDFN